MLIVVALVVWCSWAFVAIGIVVAARAIVEHFRADRERRTAPVEWDAHTDELDWRLGALLFEHTDRGALWARLEDRRQVAELDALYELPAARVVPISAARSPTPHRAAGRHGVTGREACDTGRVSVWLLEQRAAQLDRALAAERALNDVLRGRIAALCDVEPDRGEW